MTNNSHEIQALSKAIRILLKKKKIKYKEVADYLQVSLPTVKRSLSKGELSVERLLNICSLAEISLKDLVSFSETQVNDRFQFSPEQELYFSKNPSVLAFLFELIKFNSITKLRQKHRLTEASTEYYREKLLNLGLINYHNNRLVIIPKGAISWSNSGPIGKRFSKEIIKGLSNNLLKQIENGKEPNARLLGLKLTKQNLKELNSEINDIIKKYRAISNYNKKLLEDNLTQHISCMFCFDEWDADIFYKIPNISIQK